VKPSTVQIAFLSQGRNDLTADPGQPPASDEPNEENPNKVIGAKAVTPTDYSLLASTRAKLHLKRASLIANPAAYKSSEYLHHNHSPQGYTRTSGVRGDVRKGCSRVGNENRERVNLDKSVKVSKVK
jgi:hypothetical protein